MLLASMYFSSENKNLFKNLNSLKICAYYHLCKDLFRLSWENAGSYSRVFTVFFFEQYSFESFNSYKFFSFKGGGITKNSKFSRKLNWNYRDILADAYPWPLNDTKNI